jgi:hypothetical protein
MGPKGQGMILLLLAFIAVVAFLCIREVLLIQKAKRQRRVYEKHFGRALWSKETREQIERTDKAAKKLQQTLNRVRESHAEKGGVDMAGESRCKGIIERAVRLTEGAVDSAVDACGEGAMTVVHLRSALDALSHASANFDDDAKAKALADDADRFDREQSKLQTSGLDDVDLSCDRDEPVRVDGEDTIFTEDNGTTDERDPEIDASL